MVTNTIIEFRPTQLQNIWGEFIIGEEGRYKRETMEILPTFGQSINSRVELYLCIILDGNYHYL